MRRWQSQKRRIRKLPSLAVYGQRKTLLRLGASKSQTGHLEAAAGLCAVVRAVA
ncbi:hypothetical protein [Xenorhabdus bovienii]|nr:hypothetical protein [Xenorhabdus bovienii]